MPQNRKKRLVVSRSHRKPLSKTMLLPHTASYVHKLVLHNHIALATFRAGKGNGDLLAELVKVLYLAWHLQEAGFDAADRELYPEVEGILDSAARNTSKDIWFIAAEECDPLTQILDLHERQLSSAPVYAVDEAQQRVLHFGKSEKRSPWRYSDGHFCCVQY
ncbi:hypothetical protein R69746_08616 [Paraburkholderia aspalathi]|uniref:hypothetical protein n=1 Tax=Paraburkholderia aspalathi TaxID=1324617 RepID=UPI00190BC3C7|nr:hypothetical protein [Paraburkholderia aspalathi]MBK3844510.1 hypothetical protein [Paraburkholderia aspalathi]CAE6873612.1 hypothetical protein R69746_08616 [Paraburkholderia aspalathi]